MQSFKIDNFRKDNGIIPFPPFRTLGTEECDKIRFEIGAKVRLAHEASGLDLVKKISKISQPVTGISAASDEFSLTECIARLNIAVTSLVIINWYRYDNIDEFHLDDLDRWFSYIWYPGVDDIDILDASRNWVLSIAHDGKVSSTEL